jgi:hypothetical protein
VPPIDATFGPPAPKVLSSDAAHKLVTTEIAQGTSETPDFDAAAALAKRPTEF